MAPILPYRRNRRCLLASSSLAKVVTQPETKEHWQLEMRYLRHSSKSCLARWTKSSWHHRQRPPRWWIGRHDHSCSETDRKPQRVKLHLRDSTHAIRRHILPSSSLINVFDDCHERPLCVLHDPTRSRWRHCIGRCQWLDDVGGRTRPLPLSKVVDRNRRVEDGSVVWCC